MALQEIVTDEEVQNWTFPQPIRIGDDVVFSRTVGDMEIDSMRSRMPGKVIRVSQRTADLACFCGGYVIRTSCRHYQDPEIKLRPHLIGESHTGVFRLSDAAIEHRRLLATLTAHESTIQELIKNIEHLKAAIVVTRSAKGQT
jgi:hypothetical protein